MTRIENVARLVRGVTFKKPEASPEPGQGLVPIARAGNIEGDRAHLDRDLVYVPSERVAEEQYLRSGDILLATSSGSLSVVGKSALITQDWHGAHGAFMAVIRPCSDIDAAFLGYFVQSEDVRRQWRQAAAGTNINNLKKPDLLSTEIVICPSSEQQRVVAAIEEHLARLEVAESALRLALRRVEALRSSLLADAFHANSRPPSDWKLTTIGDIATVQLGRQRSPQHHAGSQMRPYLRSANVTWQGISLGDVKQMNFDDTDFARYRLEPGDLLLNEASGSPSEVGKPAIWNGEIENCCFQNTLLRLRPHEIEVEYLYWYCYAAARSGRFGDAGRGVNIRHLGKQGLARFPVLISPVEQRGQIVSRLEEEFQQAAAIEQAARSALDRVTALRRAILAAAFSGQLVPQEPTDESASVLLERVEVAGPSREKMRKASV